MNTQIEIYDWINIEELRSGNIDQVESACYVLCWISSDFQSWLKAGSPIIYKAAQK